MVKNLPAVQETWVQSLGWEEPLEKGMAAHSSIVIWKIPWTEEPGGIQSTGSQRVGQDRVTEHSINFYTSLGVHLKCQFLKKVFSDLQFPEVKTPSEIPLL